MRRKSVVRCSIVITLLAFLSPVRAQEMAAPIETQLSLLPKILSMEKHIASRVQRELNIAIVYQRKYRASVAVMENLLLSERSILIDGIGGVSINFFPIEYSDTTELVTTAGAERLHLFYIAPLRAVDISPILQISRSLGLLTYTGVPEYVRQGVSVGIGTKGGKPLLMINVPSARAEGFVFSARLLSLSKIID